MKEIMTSRKLNEAFLWKGVGGRGLTNVNHIGIEDFEMIFGRDYFSPSSLQQFFPGGRRKMEEAFFTVW